MLQTFVGSLIIIVSALVIQFTDFLEIDPILGIAFGVVLLYASYGIIKESLVILMESVPAGFEIRALQSRLERIPGVENVHHIHAWSLSTGQNIFSTHLLVDRGTDSQRVLEDSFIALEDRDDVSFATVQVETACVDLPGSEDIDITGTHTVEPAVGHHMPGHSEA